MKDKALILARIPLILSLLAVSLAAGSARADTLGSGNVYLDRDKTYEQDLRYEANPDKTITPAKVIRWMMSMRGQTVSAPSSTEFQPIVNAHDGQVRLIAALAYKF